MLFFIYNIALTYYVYGQLFYGGSFKSDTWTVFQSRANVRSLCRLWNSKTSRGNLTLQLCFTSLRVFLYSSPFLAYQAAEFQFCPRLFGIYLYMYGLCGANRPCSTLCQTRTIEFTARYLGCTKTATFDYRN